MKNTKSSYTITILTELLAGKALVSNDMHVSNANQYFCDIKNTGIELVETWDKNHTNNGRHKVRELELSIENIQKAKKYLNRLMGIKSKNNEKNSRSH
ncbi:hypothetical protein [Sulfurimonas sp.]|jgi:hypothetical protein|uniref:hypothetical protein n=1 Tax=Sulfurimonas sp. TaxID=2022749 RepID=UPI0025D4FBC0|nr:hypothetical protein [Sulfurimonas sp.]MBT5934977.1 hypothetical protein [Sulfurimonas sp.]